MHSTYGTSTTSSRHANRRRTQPPSSGWGNPWLEKIEREKEASLNKLRVKFDIEQKGREIAHLQSENKIKDLQAQQDAQTRLI